MFATSCKMQAVKNNKDMKKIYTVAGSTSAVGSVIAKRLTSMGNEVRGISRSEGVSMDDTFALHRAFSRADGAFIMIPFDMQAPDLHQREVEIGQRLATAIASGGVKRIVLLSGLNAPLRKGSSLGAALMEERLNAMNIPELVHLRAGFFMENFFKGLGFLQQATSGVFRTAFRGDIPMPMIAAKDIGEVAAQILVADSFDQPRIVELPGPKRHTMEEATRLLGSLIGRPELRYEQSSLEESRVGMSVMGLSESFINAVIETAISFNNNDPWGKEESSSSSLTPTTLARFGELALSIRTSESV
jgi:uncharacterized protein YbjT (DUF2867 family)